MTARSRRTLKWAALVVIAALAARVLWDFPWKASAVTLRNSELDLMALALAVNLVSLVLKGLGWHLLLKSVTPSRWWVIQEANLLGAAVNDLAIGALGEAARVRFIVKRVPVPLQTAVASVFWTRAVESFGFGLFVLVAPSFQHEVHRLVRGMQVAAGLMLLLLLGLVWLRRGATPGRWVPSFAHRWVAVLSEIGSPRRLRWPLLLALVSWSLQWATFHLTLLASHAVLSYSASFTALVATNLAGCLQLTPGNIGVMQGSIVLGLLPFDVPVETAVAAGLALQAIQVIPVLILGALLVGRKGLVEMAKESRPSEPQSPLPDDLESTPEPRRKASSGPQ